MLPTRRVGITWNGIVVSFFWGSIMLVQDSLFCIYKVDNNGPLSLAEYSVYNSRQCSFNAVLQCSGKFNEL